VGDPHSPPFCNDLYTVENGGYGGNPPSCNHLPQLPADDDGTWRRIEAVPFESKFVEQPNPNNKNEFPRDEHLSIKMKTWIQPFSYLLIKYYKKYQQSQITVPQKILAQIKLGETPIAPYL
jgi:hypothetical protein